MGTADAMTGLQIYDWVVVLYMVTYLVYALHTFFWRKAVVGRLGTFLLCASLVGHTVFLVLRALYYYQQHQGFVLPATNMFEAIGFFAWLVVIIYLIAEQVLFKTRFFGVVGLLIPLVAMAYTAQTMESGAGDPRELMPSLKSYWLVFHVAAMFISYAALALAFAFALMFILRARGLKGLQRLDQRFTSDYLDEMSSKLTYFAFPILSLGIFLGAVWAHSAWGQYWSWDPKENWALITWFVYLVYLHLRLQRGWVGYRSALMNVIGFVAVLITFVGVNLLVDVFKMESIHAYATGSGGVFFLGILGFAVAIPLVMLFVPAPKDTESPELEATATEAVALDAGEDNGASGTQSAPRE